MIYSDFEFDLQYLNSTESTNIHARRFLSSKSTFCPTVFYTDNQTSGKGQGSNQWVSEPMQNLAMSMLIAPELEVKDQFLLSQIAALSIIGALDKLTAIKAEIKWPNDILIGPKKVAGILIENTIKGDQLVSSIIGIGINVNQIHFPPFKRAATSLKLEHTEVPSFDCILKEILSQFKHYFQLLSLNNSKIEEAYLNKLFAYEKEIQFKDTKGPFKGTIKGIANYGKLKVERKEGLKNYDLKEIEFID